MRDIATLSQGLHTISDEIGILQHIVKLPRMNLDPLMVNYGVWPCNTQFLSGERYGGRSAGCGYTWTEAVLGTIGETVERYAAAFYDKRQGVFSTFKNLNRQAIHPGAFALFHPEQFKDKQFGVCEFTIDTPLTWFPTVDLTNGKETWLPGQFIYLPFSQDKNYITVNTSTGLAAHTDYHSAILTGLYEAIERDCFTITWMQNLVTEKIALSNAIQAYIDRHFPCQYEWHFFDINYDLGVPSVMGFCFGEADFGKFIAVGSSTRATYGEALKKVIQEIGQAVPYFRYLLNEKKDWKPGDDYTHIQDFEKHSVFYIKRQDLWNIFDKWANALETKQIDLHEKSARTVTEEIQYILRIMKRKGYPVLLKDITTHDVRQLGFFSVKVFIPQLIQLSGAYRFYFLGGSRLYTVPKSLGYPINEYDKLNPYPHPFP